MTATSLPRRHLGVRAAAAWTRCYTWGLAGEVGAERRAEMAADLHDHTQDALAASGSPGRLSREVLARAVLGIPADLAWRHAQLRMAGRRNRPTDPAAARSGPHRLHVTVLTVGAVVDVLALALALTASFYVPIWRDLAWWLHLAATAAATTGLVLLVRGSARGAALLGMATLGMAVVWYWSPIAWLAAVPLAVFFGFAANRLPGSPSISGPGSAGGD